MSTSTLQTNELGSGTLIAGYFEDGQDAHRAIQALIDSGFLPSQIGAAFHSAGAESAGEAVAEESIRQAPGRTFNQEAADVDTSAGGASSGSDAVQPVGLASGSGSPILGAGNPPPIPGSSLAHTGLPHELKSELGHDQPASAYAQSSSAPVAPSAPQHPAANTSWTSKLKHLFSKNQTSASKGEGFGTGAGDLKLTSLPYSRASFETSVNSAGVPADQSRHLSHRLATGGAVVTVSDTGRAVEVEKIFERFNGDVRFESDIFADAAGDGYVPHVEVFGHLEHYYRGV
jgi:hypothetical protein